MRTLRYEGENNDIDVQGGSFVVLEGVAALEDRIKRALKVIKGEWFLDLDYGTGYFGVGGAKPSMTLLGAEIKEVVSGMPGFKRFLRFSIMQDKGRKLVVSFRAEFDEGVVEMEV